MRVPRTKSIFLSLLLFVVIGLIVHESMGPNLCAHQGRMGLATAVALILLVVSCLFTKTDKSDSRSARRVISYVLVIVVSIGIWYEIWSIQSCSAGTRGNMVHQSR